MSTEIQKTPKDSLIAAGIFTASVLYYAFLIFHFLPRVQLAKYQTAAELYRQGKLPAERLSDFSPLYFYLHFFLHNPLTISWIHVITLGAATALFFLILRRFFRLPVALAGAILFLTDRSINAYSSIFEPESLLIFFTIAFVYFHFGSTRKHILLCGVFFGLALLCRPIFLPLLTFIPFIFYSQQRPDWKKVTLLFFVPVLCAFAVIWIRNALLLPKFSPTIMNPGTVFFEGNNPNSHGQSSIYPPLVNEFALGLKDQPDPQHVAYRLIARRIAGKELSVSEVNSYWTSKAIDFLRDHPRWALYVLRMKLFHTFHQYLWHDLANGRENEKLLEAQHWPAFPFAGISMAALLGVFLLRKRLESFLTFYLLFFIQLGGFLLFYVSARHHAVMVFSFVFFACATLQYLLESSRTTTILTVLALAALSPLFAWKTGLMKEEDHLWEASRVSNSLLRAAYENRAAGKMDQASGFAAKSLARAPWYYESRRPANLPFRPEGFEPKALGLAISGSSSEEFDRANLMLLANKPVQAQGVFANLYQSEFQAKRDFYQSSSLPFYLSRTAPLTDSKRAVRILQDALERAPGDPWILADLTVLTGQAQYSDQLLRYFDDLDARLFLGKSYLHFGKPAEAAKCFSFVTQALPEYRTAHIYLAAAFGEEGKLEDGVREYRNAIRMAADPLILDAYIIPLFQKYAENRPEDPFAVFSYGVVLRQFGFFAEALPVQQKALTLAPGNAQIQMEINSLQKMTNRP